MSRVIHFEIQAENTECAMTFYEALFGWKFSRWGDQKYWLISTGDKSAPGIDGGLLPRPCAGGPQDGAPVNAYVCTVDVDNLDASIERALQAGATLALPKVVIPTVGWLAYCKDTEGNIFGMMQMDAKAR
jgi:predicted enzyme related to lactoylglutathione lyase